MKLAVVTPFSQTQHTWLQQCLDSVARQTIPCTHFLVCEGVTTEGFELSPRVELLPLPRSHEDGGNAARVIGSVSAICQGYEGLAYLDAEHWYEGTHLEKLVESYQNSRAAVCSTRRQLHALDGTLLGDCPDVDGERFVDTNCLLFTRAAFSLVAAWYMIPRSKLELSARVLWRAVLDAKLPRAHQPEATVHCRTSDASHYRHFGLEPPPGARETVSATRVSARGHTAIIQAATVPAPPTTMTVVPSTRTPAVGSVALATPRESRARVSLCLIAKNEEANLPGCLQPLLGLVDEIVVIDTGSTDRTRELARELGAQVHDFSWCDDFSAARNEFLRLASGDWIFWLDADERLDAENCQGLERLFRQLSTDNRVYLMKQWSLPGHPTEKPLVVEQARLFRRWPGIRWQYRLHEQILPSLRAAGGIEVISTDVIIHHLGYQNPQLRQEKLQRNMRILKAEEADRPHDAFTLFNLGSGLNQGDLEQAEAYLQRSLQLAKAGTSFLPRAQALLTQVQRALGS